MTVLNAHTKAFSWVRIPERPTKSDLLASAFPSNVAQTNPDWFPMRHLLGPYVLDEEGRDLTLRGVPVPVQPRVFDLLAYLVRNAGRVVPKDELMDTLWPDVIVTEASLQRLVSLARRALQEGGLDSSIRNFVRHGYRFAIDAAGLGVAEPEHSAASNDERTRALELAQQRDWTGAAKVFETLDGEGHLSAADIDIWALAVECEGRPVRAIPILSRAIAAHLDEGAPHLAARNAVTMAKIELERSAPAASTGWLDRAEALLGEFVDPRTSAYLLWMRSRLASFGGKPEEALALARQAHDAAQSCNNPGLISLALCYQGFYNIALGRTEEGVTQQNHAAAIALSSRVDPIVGSTVYCNILWSCRTFPDWSRAKQWSVGFESWCQASFATVPGSCDLHRAEILAAQRDLETALSAIELAIPKLSEEETWSIGDGYRVRGDIHAMIGDMTAARADYAAAYACGWDAEPGNAVLLAESGHHDAALTALNRALSGSTWYHLQRRGILLANKVRIAAMANQREIAAEAMTELGADAGRWTQASVHALINEARYYLESSAGAEATRFLLLARQLWTSAGMDYHAARVRLDLARVLFSAGDEPGAQVELHAAVRTASRIGSRRLREQASALERVLQPA